MIKAVLFDYGGVLSPGGRSLSVVYGRLLGIPAEQVKLGDLHRLYRSGDISTEDYFIRLSEQYGKPLTAEQFTQYSDIFVRNKAVYALANKLRAAGIKTGILSNVYSLSAKILQKDGYYDGFEPVLLSYQEHLSKPDPDFYKLAIQRLGVEPQEILFLDDQEKCLNPARDMGMHVIKAEDEAQIVADIKAVMKQQNGLEL